VSSPSGAHGRALALLRAWSPPDPAQAALRERYVDHLLARPDGLERTCRPDHLTASTLVLSGDGRQALLTLHAKAGRWFQLGGHLEPDDDGLVAAAEREAREESGLGEVVLDPVPVHLDAHPVPFCGGTGATHLDVRFLAVADPAATTAVSAESADVRWWPVGGLPSDEESLEELVRLGRRRLRRGITGA
jgi:8-oxo-dGTP pyrophosphatase MutT (NUDIX family)